MSLDVARLENVRELPGGIAQARCPACAEDGHDRTGEHLRIYPDGRFGCCVHPKDGVHRKRIFALAGDRGKLPFPSPGTFALRLKTPPALPATQSVKAALIAFNSGTPQTESESGVPRLPDGPVTEIGTLGTAKVKLRARAREDCSNANIDMVDFHGELKDWRSAVPPVPCVPSVGAAEPLSVAGERLPHLTPGGTLSIPFDSPERYHWWRGGQSVAATLAEVRAGLANQERMKHAVTV